MSRLFKSNERRASERPAGRIAKGIAKLPNPAAGIAWNHSARRALSVRPRTPLSPAPNGATMQASPDSPAGAFLLSRFD